MSAFPSAAAAAAFDSLAQDADEGGENAGEVRISGQIYRAGVVLGEIHHVPSQDGGGMLRRQLAHVTVRKTLLPSPPAKDALVTVNGIEFKIDYVDGQNSTDAAWTLQAVRFPQ